MEAVKNDRSYALKFPTDTPAATFEQKVKAREVWKIIVHNAWKSAEPGILFWDTIIRESIPDCYRDEGFQQSLPIHVVRYHFVRMIVVVSLRLTYLVYVSDPFTKDARFDFDLFKKHSWIAHRIMDDIVDLEIEKIDKIIEKVESDPSGRRSEKD